MAVDLVSKLSEAATAVIEAQRADLERDPASLRSVVLELELDRRQQLGECECYLQRRVNVRDVLGLRWGEQ